jgi:hypothetical protein
VCQSYRHLKTPRLPTQPNPPSPNTHTHTDKAVSRGKPYAERKLQLQFDSLWLSTLGLAVTWALTSFEASVSYGLGALLGLGYVTLLARSVEAIGGTGGPGAFYRERERESMCVCILCLCVSRSRRKDDTRNLCN